MEAVIRLSIFPSAPNLPRNKQEKIEAAKKMIQPEIVEIISDEDLIRIIESYTWSPYIFNGNRKQENFKSSDFAVLDLDNGLSIEEAERIITEANFTCLCMVTTSHKPEHHRFRLILPLSRTVTDKATMIATMEDLYEAFPQADRSCITDLARAYFSATSSEGFWIEGDLLEPVEPPKMNKTELIHRFNVSSKVTTPDDVKAIVAELYGEERETIPEAVAHFLTHAHTGLPDTWICDLNSFSFILSLQGIDLDTIKDLVAYLSPMPQSPREIATIERAVKDGQEAAKAESEE